MEFTLSNCLLSSYLRLFDVRTPQMTESGLFNIGFGLFIYILIPFSVFLKILCTLTFLYVEKNSQYLLIQYTFLSEYRKTQLNLNEKAVF